MLTTVIMLRQVGTLRTKDETETTLKSLFEDAQRVGGKAAFKKLKTETGVKDTFFEFFANRLFAAPGKRRGVTAEEALYQVLQTLPKSVYSPVWRIKGPPALTQPASILGELIGPSSIGLDPHWDTPVEILHVILLGFLKYFWRDAISRLTPEQKALLAIRLSSYDVSGLGISPLPGFTLVQYAGSLTGRDFRTIAQVAPHVLYDLVSKDSFES